MKAILIIFISLLFFTHANAQLKVDAGNNIVHCFSDLSSSTAQLGGNPTASSGVEPYTYTWSGKILQHFGPKDSTWVYASYFLNYTTQSNPTFKRGKIPFDWPVFKLKVKDAAGKIQNDSIKVIDGSIWSCGPYFIPVTIHKGDSIRFHGDTNYDCDNNLTPLKFMLSPTYGLTDPTDLYGWAKPDKSTTYYLQVTNSVGCIAKSEYLKVIVEPPVSNNELANQPFQCYLTNGDLVVKRGANNDLPYQLTIATANGSIVYSCESTDWNLRLSNLNLKENQLYIVSITDGNEKATFKLFGN